MMWLPFWGARTVLRGLALAWCSLWMAFLVAIVGSLPGAPTEVRAIAKRILSEFAAANTTAAAPTPNGGSGSSVVQLPSSPGAGAGALTIPAHVISPGAIAWCATPGPLVEELSGATKVCGSGNAPSSSIEAVGLFLDASGELVSAQGKAAGQRIATATEIVDQGDDPAIPASVRADAADLVAEGDGSDIAVLDEVGEGTDVVVFISGTAEVTVDLYKGNDAAAVAKTAGMGASIAAGYLTSEYLCAALFASVVLDEGPAEIVCGFAILATSFASAYAAQGATSCLLDQRTCSPPAPPPVGRYDCTAPCSGSSPAATPPPGQENTVCLAGGNTCPAPAPLPVGRYDCTAPCSSSPSGATGPSDLLDEAFGDG